MHVIFIIIYVRFDMKRDTGIEIKLHSLRESASSSLNFNLSTVADVLCQKRSVKTDSSKQEIDLTK